MTRYLADKDAAFVADIFETLLAGPGFPDLSSGGGVTMTPEAAEAMRTEMRAIQIRLTVEKIAPVRNADVYARKVVHLIRLDQLDGRVPGDLTEFAELDEWTDHKDYLVDADVPDGDDPETRYDLANAVTGMVDRMLSANAIAAEIAPDPCRGGHHDF